MDSITIDRNTLKALGADTRIAILKQLNRKRMTQAELATELGMAAPSVKEHLERLEQAKLVEQKDEGRKWKYFELTTKGAGIIQPSNTKIWFLLAVSFLAFAFATMQVYPYFFAAQPEFQAAQIRAEISPQYAPSAASANAEAQRDDAQQTTQPEQLTDSATPKAAANPPLAEAIAMLASLLVVGACIGVLIKKD